MPNLSVSNLEPEQMMEAYPLIRRSARVVAEDWSVFGCRLAEQGGGVLAVRAEDGQVHGIAAYLPVASLRHGKALRVEAIAAFELGHVSLVRNRLSSALDSLARAQGCQVVLINLDAKGVSSPRSRRRRGWESLGLTAESIGFVRQVDHNRTDPAEPVKT